MTLNNKEITELLISYGANIDSKDNYGFGIDLFSRRKTVENVIFNILLSQYQN